MYKGSSAKSWRKYKIKYRLVGNQGIKSGKKYYPPVFVSEKNSSKKLKEYEFKPEGKLITWSIIHGAPKGYEEYAPYIVGIVELEDGERITSQIVNIKKSQLKYGLKLKAVFRKIYQDGDEGIIDYGVKFTLK
jgi:hypothetical protein